HGSEHPEAVEEGVAGLEQLGASGTGQVHADLVRGPVGAEDEGESHAPLALVDQRAARVALARGVTGGAHAVVSQRRLLEAADGRRGALTLEPRGADLEGGAALADHAVRAHEDGALGGAL